MTLPKIPLSCHAPECTPNYKALKTSYNNPNITCQQHYSKLAKHNANGNARKLCSLNNFKNRNTGTPKPIITTYSTPYIRKQYPMKIFCSYVI